MPKTLFFHKDAYATTVVVLLTAAALRWSLVATSWYPMPFTGLASVGPFLIALCVLRRIAETKDMTSFALVARTSILFLLLVAYLPESNEAILHLARGVPYADDALGRADRALGFDWLAYVAWLDGHPFLWDVCAIAYLSIWPQIIMVGVILSFRTTGERACAFFTAQALTLSATCLCAGLFPALGAFAHWDGAHALVRRAADLAVADHMTETLEWVRTSEWAAPPRQVFHAIVSFPSYHAACCVILTWSTWSDRRLRLPFSALNCAMLAATPAQGSHYLVDVLAGIAIGAVAMVVAKALTRADPARTVFARICELSELFCGALLDRRRQDGILGLDRGAAAAMITGRPAGGSRAADRSRRDRGCVGLDHVR